MEKFRGRESCDWESFPENKSGHDALVRHLKEIVESKYRLKFVEFDEEGPNSLSIPVFDSWNLNLTLKKGV